MTPPETVEQRVEQILEMRSAEADMYYDAGRAGNAVGVYQQMVKELRDLLAAPAAPLFRTGNFTLHSGERTTWKIDCDALTDADLAALAAILASVLPPFGAVEGVPSGGLKLAAALGQYVSTGPLLIVDDVLTTGASLEAQRDGRGAIGAVLFARGPCPAWVRPLFSLAAPTAPGWQDRPKIICLCGSTRFIETFAVKTWELELEGYIVLGCTLLPSWYCPVRDHFAETLGVKDQRDRHHLQKIDLADEVLVLNVGGYIGESTRNEIAYATTHGKPVTYLEPLPAPPGAASQEPKS